MVKLLLLHFFCYMVPRECDKGEEARCRMPDVEVGTGMRQRNGAILGRDGAVRLIMGEGCGSGLLFYLSPHRSLLDYSLSYLVTSLYPLTHFRPKQARVRALYLRHLVLKKHYRSCHVLSSPANGVEAPVKHQ